MCAPNRRCDFCQRHGSKYAATKAVRYAAAASAADAMNQMPTCGASTSNIITASASSNEIVAAMPNRMQARFTEPMRRTIPTPFAACNSSVLQEHQGRLPSVTRLMSNSVLLP